MMDTVVSITLYDGSEEILNNAISMCRDYEQLFSRTITTSDIGRINSAEGKPVEVSSDTISLLNKAIDICDKSNGKFDITVCPITDLWDVSNSKTIPNNYSIESALKLVDYKKIKIENNTVTLPKGMALDLGGIAKGYIADMIAQYLSQNNVTSAIINLGGNILVIGNKQGKPYNVGIQKPFSHQGEISAEISIENKSTVTSGVYQRYFEENGKIYHHITDTATGYPIDNEVNSVTVIADSSALADGLSTTCLALGIEEGKKFAESYGAEAIFINKNGEISYTNGIVLVEDGKIPKFKLK